MYRFLNAYLDLDFPYVFVLTVPYNLHADTVEDDHSVNEIIKKLDCKEIKAYQAM